MSNYGSSARVISPRRDYHTHDHSQSTANYSVSSSNTLGLSHLASGLNNGSTLITRTSTQTPTVTLRSSRAAASSTTSRERARVGQETLSLGEIESEFIKNLQNQIYYLELECKFLREESQKNHASENCRQAIEARAELSEKITEWNKQFDDLSARLREKEITIQRLEADNHQLHEQVQSSTHGHVDERKEFVGVVTELKRRVEQLDREVGSRDTQIVRLKQDLNQVNTIRIDREKG